MDIQDSIEKLNFEANQQISLKGSDFSPLKKNREYGVLQCANAGKRDNERKESTLIA